MYIMSEYLVYKHYEATEDDSISELIAKASRTAYLDFCRRISFQRNVPVQKRDLLQKEVDQLFSEMVPCLIKTVQMEYSQKHFDEIHHEICESVIKIYENTGSGTYGMAQRWLNHTLINLAIIASHVGIKSGQILNARKYFHVPVDKYILEIATSKSKRFQNGLRLKCAPLRHEQSESYQMDWYSSEKTQPVECWGYVEYREFQDAIKEKLFGLPNSMEHCYQYAIEWALCAYIEGQRAHYKYQ